MKQKILNILVFGIALFMTTSTSFALSIGGVELTPNTLTPKTSIDEFLTNPPKDAYIPPSGGSDTVSLLLNYAGIFRKLIAVLAVLFIVIAGIRIVTASGNEEIVKKNRISVLWLLIGLIFMNIAEPFVAIFFGDGKTLDYWSYASSVPAEARTKLINPLVNYFLTFLTAIAVLMVVMAALKMMTSQGDEGKVKKQTGMIVGTLLGLFMMIIAKPLVSAFFGYEEMKPDLSAGVKLVVDISNYIMGFAGFFAVVMMIYSGVTILTNFGNDQRVQKARKQITWILIGMALLISAYTIVRTFIAPNL